MFSSNLQSPSTHVSQERMGALLLEIEKSLGAQIESDLEKRNKQLINANVSAVIDEYMQLDSVRKFCKRMKSVFPEIEATRLSKILKDYFESQIYFSQSVSVECDLLLVSQQLRQSFGLDTAIELLENIQNPAFPLDKFMKDLQAKIVDDNHKFQTILEVTYRLRNLYFHVDIKKQVNNTEDLQQEASYQHMQESLMWINGQKLTCLIALKNIRDNHVDRAESKNDAAATPLQGARDLIQNTIGLSVDDELQKLEKTLASSSLDDILQKIKSNEEYIRFVAALRTDTRAGLNTFLPNASTQELQVIVEEFLQTSIHLAQSIRLERSVVRISQAMRQQYGIGVAVKLLSEMAKTHFNINQFFAGKAAPSAEIKSLIQNVTLFYIYSNLKKHDSFFDAEDSQAKKLFESNMWLDLQRRRCIEGMLLIQSGAAYRDEAITLSENAEEITPDEEVIIIEDEQARKKTKLESKDNSNAQQALGPSIIDLTQLEPAMEDIVVLDHSRKAAKPAPNANPVNLHGIPAAQNAANMAASREMKRREQNHSAVVEDLNGMVDEDDALNQALQLSLRESQNRVAVNRVPAPSAVMEDKRDYSGRTEMMIAASKGDLETVTRLVQSGRNIHALGPDNKKAIHYAAEGEHENVMGYLISMGASPIEGYGRDNRTAHDIARIAPKFLSAAYRGDVNEITRYIVNLQVPVDIRGMNNQTALMRASENGKIDAVRLLCETYEADIHARSQNQRKPIHFAAAEQHENVMAYLITQGASAREGYGLQNTTALDLAGIPAKFLGAAYRGENNTIIRYITTLQVPVDIRGINNQTALMRAAEQGKQVTVILLHETYHADIHARSQDQRKPIHYAASGQHENVMAYFITQGASPTEGYGNNNTTAHELAGIAPKFLGAAYRGENNTIIRYITTLQVPVDIRGMNNQTALMRASEQGKQDTVILLHETYHADIHARSQDQRKPIHYAASGQHEDVMAYFITHGASATEGYGNYNTTAHELAGIAPKFLGAAYRGENARLTHYITTLQVPVDIRGLNNQTALMKASETGKTETVILLVETHHANIHALSSSNQTAIQIAEQNRKEAVITYLSSRGAVASSKPAAVPFAMQQQSSSSSSSPALNNNPVHSNIQSSFSRFTGSLFNSPSSSSSSNSNASPANQPLGATDGSILNDAIVLLNAIEHKAKLMKDEKNDASKPHFHTSEENDSKYHKLRNVVIPIPSLELTKERFYAATELLVSALNRIQSAETHPELQMFLNSGPDQTTLRIDHNMPYLYRLHHRMVSDNELPAPINCIPFTPLRYALHSNIKDCFAGWQTNSASPDKAFILINNEHERSEISVSLMRIEKPCSELQKGFSFDMRINQQMITINKESLDAAQVMIGYSMPQRAPSPMR